MNPGIAYHEDILERIELGPQNWSGAADYALFRHVDSLHAFTEAYGRPTARYACWCNGPVSAGFELDEVCNAPDRQSRWRLKITATWRDWRKGVHPVQIAVNGEAVYDGPFFLENVLAGWPAQYVELPPRVLHKGHNEICITIGSGTANTLLLAGAELLQFPDCVDFSVHAVPDICVAGESFWIRLHLLREHADIEVQVPGELVTFTGREGPLFFFRAHQAAVAVPAIRFTAGDLHCEAILDRIVPAHPAGHIPFRIGMDGDDLRHDRTGEMDCVLEHFIYSGVGNYMGFRPKPGRNTCRELYPTCGDWERWVRLCRTHGVHLHLSGDDVLDGFDVRSAAGDCFSGYQFHEPYLVFQPLSESRWITPRLVQARNLQEKKEAYVDYLRGRVASARLGEAPVYSGEPSLTCIYSAEAGVDALLCEPVSNISLLYGAARGSGLPFGAHIPADWYFGYPHDARALRRVQLALWLTYAYGGRVAYVESSAFKTNAHERNDWEDTYCVGVRQQLRDLYRFSRTDHRPGKPVVPLALVYGNLESMFWMDDDRIPETADMDDWDRRHWGLPGPTPHRRVWTASEAWLPRVPPDDPRNESLTRMFTGTPYGPVDVVSPDRDLSRYRAVALLGWNTMTEEIYQNLLRVARRGGIVFICGCHFDTRVDPEAPPQMLRGGAVQELIGARIAGPGRDVLPGLRACELMHVTAENSDPHFLVHRVGAGHVHFGNFYDYPTDVRLIDRITDRLRAIGEQVRVTAPVRIDVSSPYLHYSLWEDKAGFKVYAVDADWRDSQAEATLTVVRGGVERTLSLRGSRMGVLSQMSEEDVRGGATRQEGVSVE